MTAKQEAIRALYRQVRAPEWAAPNLDALSDVLRDLSWLPAGPVTLQVPDLGPLTDGDRAGLLVALWRAATDSAGTRNPITVRLSGSPGP